MTTAEDSRRRGDRILTVWTPRILRGALAVSMVLLVAGLIAIAATEPGDYVARFHALRQAGALAVVERPSDLLRDALHGQPRALLLVGLLALTLVPIGRVAFCLVVFLRERDWMFSALTAIVLGLLFLGVFLGRMG